MREWNRHGLTEGDERNREINKDSERKRRRKGEKKRDTETGRS